VLDFEFVVTSRLVLDLCGDVAGNEVVVALDPIRWTV